MKRVTLYTILVALAAGALVVDMNDEHFTLGGDAQAVVGRPLTPVSYAGVARRTARRTTRRTVAASGAYAAPVAGTVTALPTGCVAAGGVYTCGAVRYRPYYDGPTVVYQVVQ